MPSPSQRPPHDRVLAVLPRPNAPESAPAPPEILAGSSSFDRIMTIARKVKWPARLRLPLKNTLSEVASNASFQPKVLDIAPNVKATRGLRTPQISNSKSPR